MRKGEEVPEVLKRWEDSGLTQQEFGEREGIAYTTLVYWRRRLKEIEMDERAAEDGASFAPLRLVEDRPANGRFEVRVDDR